MTNERLLPQAPDIERAVIGQMLAFPDETAAKIIRAGNDIFYNPVHAIIAREVEYLHEEGIPIDQVTVSERLRARNVLDRVGGEASLTGFFMEAASASGIDYHLKTLRDKAFLRKIALGCTDFERNLYDPMADPHDIASSMLEFVKTTSAEYSSARKSRTEEIREWVVTTKGDFLTTDVYNEFAMTTRDEKKTGAKILSRLIEEGLIEPAGSRRGRYRLIDMNCERIDLSGPMEEALPLRWPFGLEELAETMAHNIVVVAGEPNAGKTAFLLNFVRMNMERFDIHYFSSEMGSAEFKKRLAKFDSPQPDRWRFTPWERSTDFADVIRPDAVNIIDYMEIHEDFYRLGAHFKSIYDRLKKGVAIIAIQKNSKTDVGRGGEITLDKPRLYLLLSPGEIKIRKAKNWASNENPSGLTKRFKLVGGAKIVEQGGWRM